MPNRSLFAVRATKTRITTRPKKNKRPREFKTESHMENAASKLSLLPDSNGPLPVKSRYALPSYIELALCLFALCSPSPDLSLSLRFKSSCASSVFGAFHLAPASLPIDGLFDWLSAPPSYPQSSPSSTNRFPRCPFHGLSRGSEPGGAKRGTVAAQLCGSGSSTRRMGETFAGVQPEVRAGAGAYM